ncbi:PilN domain-containing protein [Oxynema aestuarii]|jgi:type IV pilus assembly protein PilN|uniref:Tfp pilus assembly protein PilN n=1 Tax=Oxynema aestuarii AP17 TaxID=2064643 RepID=A0A6H1TV89_9CYAN|nr:PilN domain-containing protein [Oxynema aestuarii]QIZ70534.1 hypothetical protein HCG48_08020 [Oxynema aestuarii AP17]RMH72568.1 MAG: hypothetical protein D6680_18690 [Cyanobacteria bacterium J007]
MYSLDINFLNDRPGFRQEPKAPRGSAPSTGKDRTIQLIGLGAGVASIALVLGFWAFIEGDNSRLRQEEAQLQSELDGLGKGVQELEAINAEIQQIQTQVTFFANIFNTSLKPLSALLQELREQVPVGVQVSKMEHTLDKAEGDEIQSDSPWSIVRQEVTISGLSRSFDEVNDFVLTLKSSPFFVDEQTELVVAELVDNPTAIECDKKFEDTDVTCPPDGFQLPKVVQYTITARVSNAPAATMLAELQRNGADGLTTRIKTLEGLGVLER